MDNDLIMSTIEQDSYMMVHALFQFNEAVYGLTCLVVDWMTFHDSTLLYWQSKHVDWVFVLDLVLYDSKKGGGNPYDRDRTMLNSSILKMNPTEN